MTETNKIQPRPTAAQQSYNDLPESARKQVDTVLLLQLEADMVAARDRAVCRDEPSMSRMEAIQRQLLDKQFLAKARQEIMDASQHRGVKIDPRLNDGLQSTDISLRDISRKVSNREQNCLMSF